MQRLKRRIRLGHVAEGLFVEREAAARVAGPSDAHLIEVVTEAISLEGGAVEHAVAAVDRGDETGFDALPVALEALQGGDVDGDAAPLHPSSGGHVAASEERLAEGQGGIGPAREDTRQHPRQEPRKGVDVGLAVVQQRRPLRGRPRPAAEGEVAHLGLLVGRHAVEAVPGHGAE